MNIKRAISLFLSLLMLAAFKERDFYVSISFDNETGKVSSISFSCETWDY